MKILQVCEYYHYLGGTEQYVLELSRELERLGHKIGVIYGTRTAETLQKRGRGEYFFPALAANDALEKDEEKKLKEIVEAEKPDIIYVHNVSNARLIEKLSAEKPLIRFVHDHRLFCPRGDKTLRSQDRICNYSCGFRCFLNAYSNRCLPRNPLVLLGIIRKKIREIQANQKIKIIVASDYMKQCLVQNGFSLQNVEILPYYCQAVARNKGEDSNDFVLFVGRIYRQKGPQFLIPALKELPERLKLVIIGGGEYLTEIKSLAGNLELENRINFLGPLPHHQVGQYYKKCLALIMPSIWPEPFGMTGIEAMSYGKPVIAFNVGGIGDWLKDGENGFLVERENVRQLVAKIELLLNDKKLCQEMGKRGKRIFEERYTKKQHLEKLLQIFEETRAQKK